MPRFPQFAFDAVAIPENGRQDKIEIEMGAWTVYGENRDEVQVFYSRMGSPPVLHARTRLREDHGDAYGWLFKTPDVSEWHSKRTMGIRSEPLEIGSPEGEYLRTVPPPLFSRSCNWKAKEIADSQPPQSGHVSNFPEAGPREKRIETTATLDIKINPTRFVRHQPVPDSLPDSFQHRTLPLAPFGEASFDRNDNWLPQSGRLLSYVRPDRWRGHLLRLLNTVEGAFESQLHRVCEPVQLEWDRTNDRYGVKYVETYWEWLSEDPLKLVHDLWKPLRSFSRRRRGRRAYDVEISEEEDHDMYVVHVEYSPGEVLKFYAKTDQRIRVEVSHRLVGDHSFRFPREVNEHGTVTRRGGHVFASKSGVLTFLEKLRDRAAEVVNKALRHLNRRFLIPTSHISGYYLIAAITNAVRNFPAALSLTSALVNRGGISAGGIDDSTRNAIHALLVHGIIERTGRQRTYVVTARYRHALQTLQNEANWPLLIRQESA